MDKTFEIMSALNETARQNGVKNIDVSVGQRRNKRGFYDYITMTFTVGRGESSLCGDSQKLSEAPKTTETESVEENHIEEQEVAENGSEALTE